MSLPVKIQKRSDGFFDLFCWGVTCVLGFLTLGLFFFLFLESWPFLSAQHVFADLAANQWYPSEGQFGFLPLIVGSAATTALALILATPISLALVVFLTLFDRHKVAAALELFIETMQGLPSIVVGLWGLTVIVPRIASHSENGSGTSLIAASLVLVLMITPTIVMALRPAVQERYKQHVLAAKALNLSTSTFTFDVLLRSSLQPILAATILGMGRAVGETMAVLLVCGNIVQIPKSIFAPVRTVNTNIALEMAYAQGLHRSSLFFGGTLLLIAVMILLAVSYAVRAKAGDA